MADARAIALLDRVLDVVRAHGLPCAIGGGLAVNLHGVERHTRAVDASFREEDRQAVLRALRKAGVPVDKVFGAAFTPWPTSRVHPTCVCELT